MHPLLMAHSQPKGLSEKKRPHSRGQIKKHSTMSVHIKPSLFCWWRLWVTRGHVLHVCVHHLSSHWVSNNSGLCCAFLQRNVRCRHHCRGSLQLKNKSAASLAAVFNFTFLLNEKTCCSSSSTLRRHTRLYRRVQSGKNSAWYWF